MNHVAIVYWSGTGNTEKMAQCIAEGVQDAGGTAALLGPGDFSADNWNDYQAVAFGCPAMGAEQLEEGEFEPMFVSCIPVLRSGGHPLRQENRSVRLLRLGRRPVDAGVVPALQRRPAL